MCCVSSWGVESQNDGCPKINNLSPGVIFVSSSIECCGYWLAGVTVEDDGMGDIEFEYSVIIIMCVVVVY